MQTFFRTASDSQRDLLGDALCAGLADKSTIPTDHATLALRLERLLAQNGHAEKHGVLHLTNLLRLKSRVAYHGATITREEAAMIVERARRFAVWANITGSGLGIEGWRDD